MQTISVLGRHRGMSTLEAMIRRVALPEEHRELVCQFLLVFSRFEAALKGATYARQDGERLIVEWRRFARETSAEARPLPMDALDPLVTRPPEREQVADHVLDWVAEARPETVTPEWVLEMVYRVRNNLFHGGKWPARVERDGELLRSCLAALAHFVDLEPRVTDAYFGE